MWKAFTASRPVRQNGEPLPLRKRSAEDFGWAFLGAGWPQVGVDKMVKVWDMATHRAKEVHCVQTIASVARVKWRPECRHHLATCP